MDSVQFEAFPGWVISIAYDVVSGLLTVFESVH